MDVRAMGWTPGGQLLRETRAVATNRSLVGGQHHSATALAVSTFSLVSSLDGPEATATATGSLLSAENLPLLPLLGEPCTHCRPVSLPRV